MDYDTKIIYGIIWSGLLIGSIIWFWIYSKKHSCFDKEFIARQNLNYLIWYEKMKEKYHWED